jgi:organic radical activating enzyme
MEKAIKITNHLSTENLYRLPWTMTDNASTWLEITRSCDISCDYCPQEKDASKIKPFDQVAYELDELIKMRKCNTIVIAGGEPLIHPELIKIVALVKEKKLKPFIITNGVSLDAERLSELKKAGLKGAILHIDSGQHRPNWENKTEEELNELRQYFTDMFKKEKDLICSFITTIIPEAIDEVSSIIHWMYQNAKDVNQIIFIPVREWHKYNAWDCFIDGKKVKSHLMIHDSENLPKYLSAGDITEEIKKALPNFEYCSFLGGTEIANAPKWAIGSYLKLGNKFLGSIGPKSMELFQNTHHLIKGTFFSFLSKRTYGLLKFGLPFLSFFDKQIRGIFFKNYFFKPWNIFRKLHFQTIIVMQPWDYLENGEYDMCDGCPNKTYFKGRLVSECRMDEYLQNGKLWSYAPKQS